MVLGIGSYVEKLGTLSNFFTIGGQKAVSLRHRHSNF